MRLVLVPSLFLWTAATIWAAPQRVRREDSILDDSPMAGVVRATSLCRSVLAASTPTLDCLPSPRSMDDPCSSAVLAMRVHETTSTNTPSTRTGNDFASGPSETIVPSSLVDASTSTPSRIMPPLRFNMFKTRSDTSDSNAVPSNDQFRTIGIVGGFLAGIALVAFMGIAIILIRHRRRARSSTTSGSTRSRTRTHSGPRVPHFLTTEVGDSNTPITRPPPLRIYTGAPIGAPTGAPTVTSNDPTTATAGHHGGMLQFPVTSGMASASSGSTSFRQPSTSAGHESGQGTPRRAPQLPSLGLNQPRPFLRSFVSLFSNNASAGHAPSVAPETEAETTTHGGGTVSLSGSKTLGATEESGITAPIEGTSEPSPKPQ